MFTVSLLLEAVAFPRGQLQVSSSLVLGFRCHVLGPGSKIQSLAVALDIKLFVECVFNHICFIPMTSQVQSE